MSTKAQRKPPPPPAMTLGTGIHYATPVFPTATRTTELHLVKAVLQMAQGFSGSIFQWDPKAHTFFLAHAGIHLSHLSLTGLHNLLSHFIYSSSCLKIVEVIVGNVGSCEGVPTLRAFASSATQWLQVAGYCFERGGEGVRVLRWGDSNAVGIVEFLVKVLLMDVIDVSLCSGAEYLLQIVNGAVPQMCFEPNSGVTAAEVAVHILDYLYKKLDEVCLVQYGEEDAYQMVLHMFVGSILPCIEGLDSWLFEATLDDPFEEMFFHAKKAISVDNSEFWEKSYQLRQVRGQKFDVTPPDLANNRKGATEQDSSAPMLSSSKGKDLNNMEIQVCPMFLKDIANSVVSAGKSLQLIRHVRVSSSMLTTKGGYRENDGFASIKYDSNLERLQERIAGLTLSEVFCLSVVGLIGNGDHISTYFLQDKLSKCHSSVLDMIKEKTENMNGGSLAAQQFPEKIWHKFFIGTLAQRKIPANTDEISFSGAERGCRTSDVEDDLPFQRPFCPENPVITVCQTILAKDKKSWKPLNLSRNFHLPPLNDEILREAVFGWDHVVSPAFEGTDYSLGFQFGKSEYLHLHDDIKMLETLFPFPTLLPSFQDNVHMSELLPFQKNSTLASRVLGWIQSVEPRITPLPSIIIHECLTIYVKEQVDYIGQMILSKLMNDWRLMDELAVLRAIYLLGSGDLLQHFLTVVFNKLDRGESWDDDFELNTILQESIRNSADCMLLSAPHSLEVSISQHHGLNGSELGTASALSSIHQKNQPPSFGIDGLESLKFTYKVPWPLELIANTDAVKKYNDVMGFLLKVKRAKFVLDKTRRWMWKGRGKVTNNRKHQWLVEQKLLHFVDAFHQYVMDRVYHSAWRELCDGMAAAGSLDEVIEVHEAYLLSIQRQCFVVPDKLWTMIGIRINNILGLALEFYSIQQMLSSGGAASTMKARCEMEVDRIEKQFDDCIAFLLRVLSFRLNVGHFPHLADLVTRINYNYFYMSDGGNLKTATGS